VNYRALALVGGGVGILALLWPRRAKASSRRQAPATLSTSSAGIDFILDEEGYSATPYLDDDVNTARVEYSIGHGHQIQPNENLTNVTRQQAREIFAQDLARFERMVQDNADVPLSQNEFDALVSWSYNVGNRPNSTLYRKLNAGDYDGAAAEFASWRMAGGKVLSALVARREAESNLFLS
jgi:lysozyme